MIFLDTNVLSEPMRSQPNGDVVGWIARNGPKLQASTVALAEVAYGIAKAREAERPRRWALVLATWRRRLGSNIHAFDDHSADIYGDIMGKAKLAGRTMFPLDGMIAAAALRHRGALATRNTKHFQIEGLMLVNPWEG